MVRGFLEIIPLIKEVLRGDSSVQNNVCSFPTERSDLGEPLRIPVADATRAAIVSALESSFFPPFACSRAQLFFLLLLTPTTSRLA